MKRVRWLLLLVPVLALFGAVRWKTHQPEYVLRQFSARFMGADLSATGGDDAVSQGKTR